MLLLLACISIALYYSFLNQYLLRHFIRIAYRHEDVDMSRCQFCQPRTSPCASAGDQFGRNRHGDGATHSNKVVSGALAAHMTSGFVPRSNIVVSEERHIWQVVSSPEPNWCSSSTPDPLIVPDQSQTCSGSWCQKWQIIENRSGITRPISLFIIFHTFYPGVISTRKHVCRKAWESVHLANN